MPYHQISHSPQDQDTFRHGFAAAARIANERQASIFGQHQLNLASYGAANYRWGYNQRTAYEEIQKARIAGQYNPQSEVHAPQFPTGGDIRPVEYGLYQRDGIHGMYREMRADGRLGRRGELRKMRLERRAEERREEGEGGSAGEEACREGGEEGAVEGRWEEGEESLG